MRRDLADGLAGGAEQLGDAFDIAVVELPDAERNEADITVTLTESATGTFSGSAPMTTSHHSGPRAVFVVRGPPYAAAYARRGRATWPAGARATPGRPDLGDATPRRPRRRSLRRGECELRRRSEWRRHAFTSRPPRAYLLPIKFTAYTGNSVTYDETRARVAHRPPSDGLQQR